MPQTEQEWIDLAQEILANAKQAAKMGDVDGLRGSRKACSRFIAGTNLGCPQEVVNAVVSAQAELSQLIVANDVAEIQRASVQFDAFLHDVERISSRAEKAADLISFATAKSIVDDVTGVITAVKALKKDIDDVEAKDNIQDIADRLAAIQEKFNDLAT